MKGQQVGIFFFRPSLGGGTTTYTAHLVKALEAAGAIPQIYKVREREEENVRPFGKYAGVYYRNITFETARKLVRKQMTLMAAPAAEKYLVRPDVIQRLMKLGMRVVIHDPNEFKIFDHLSSKQARVVTKLPTHPICIRPTMQRFYPKAVWIPHPYMRSAQNTDPFENIARDKWAVSVARIASVKRPKIILEANRLLPKRLRVELRGAEYRMYTRALEQKYGDVFKQCGSTFQFPMTFDAPVRICARYMFNVDMTYFPDDGGGTQFAQMEAMDAGTVNVMHKDWFRYPGELKAARHVLAVDGPKSLAKLLNPDVPDWPYEEVIHAGYRLLKKHAPAVVGQLYLDELRRGS